jgi:hypothetical protein
MTGAGTALAVKLELTVPALRAALAALWTAGDPPARYRARYLDYLCAMHGVIRASVPLLDAAHRRCRALPAGDPLAAPLAGYFARHAAEEAGHDEWILADLAALGQDPARPWQRVPPPAVAELVGSQYYWLEHHHPVCLLGYLAVLEGYPPAPALVQIVQAATGYPAAGFRTLARHAALDPTHRDDLRRLLDELPLPPGLAAAVGLSALHTARHCVRLLAELAADPAGAAGAAGAARPADPGRPAGAADLAGPAEPAGAGR